MLKNLFTKKRIIYGIVILFIVGVVGYFIWPKIFPAKAVDKYVTAKVARGALTNSVTGTGQVLSLNQVDIKAAVAGDVTSVPVKNGQAVKEGDVIAVLDSRSSVLKLNQAKVNLESARLALEKLISPATKSELLQAENKVKDAEDSLTKLKFSQETDYQDMIETRDNAVESLTQAYDDGYNDIVNAFVDLPSIVTGLDTILTSYEIGASEVTIGSSVPNNSALYNSIDQLVPERDKLKSYLADSISALNIMKSDFNKNIENYRATNRYSDRKTIEDLATATYESCKKIADVIKSEIHDLDYWVDYRQNNDLSVFAKVTAYQTALNTYSSKANQHLSTLFSITRAISDSKQSIADAERNLKEMDQNNPLALAQAERNLASLKEQLADLKAGAEALDIKNQQLTIQQKQQDLISAQNDVADRIIKVPFDGVVTSLVASKGNYIADNSTVCTILTNQKIAQITLNEIDVAKVKLGQKATLTFDAVDELTITGEVSEIETVGTISQGVVSYSVKILFDVQDDRIKPNMSVTAGIILSTKPDVLMVKSSAIKSDNTSSYVEVLTNNQPVRKDVQIGESNDTMTEIVSGLNEGDEVITQKISTSTTATSSSTNNVPGGNVFRELH